ncbi:MAG: patatin-like phospholipase family protein [Gallionellaceae bacterium]|nr:patatin-like phospholipase family protein [Gallionellaceae bacterium]
MPARWMYAIGLHSVAASNRMLKLLHNGPRFSKSRLFTCGWALAALLLAACSTAPKQSEAEKPVAPPVEQTEVKPAEAAIAVPPPPAEPVIAAPPPVAKPPPKIALALGGGAARGFAHVGVIKALEAQGIAADIVVGTSAGSVVGALYAAGHNGFEIQALAMQMEEGQLNDWSLPNRGFLKCEALQDFVNRAVKRRTLEKLSRVFAVVATDLHSGEMVVFRTGDTGMAVCASSAVPGLFQPIAIKGRDYVDGGLVSPVPVRVARSLGADFVIAVDISDKPKNGKTESMLDVMLQTFTIMGQSISRNELPDADIVISPKTDGLSSTDMKDRHRAVLEGEKAVAAILPELKARLGKLQEGQHKAAISGPNPR